jgi:hypothetical protein
LFLLEVAFEGSFVVEVAEQLEVFAHQQLQFDNLVEPSLLVGEEIAMLKIIHS